MAHEVTEKNKRSNRTKRTMSPALRIIWTISLLENTGIIVIQSIKGVS
jgi:hypothetical protein